MTPLEANPEESIPKEKEYHFFPWRARPIRAVNESNENSIVTMIQHFVDSMGIFSFRDSYNELLIEKDVIEREVVNVVFHAAVDSIFGTYRRNVLGSDGAYADEEQQFAPMSLSEVLDKKLAKFYQDAITRHQQHQRQQGEVYTLHYELKDVHAAKIIKHQWFYGFHRNMKRSNCEKLILKSNIFNPILDIDIPRANELLMQELELSSDNTWERIAEMNKKWNADAHNFRVTIRLWIDVECTEIFSVRSEEHGYYVQGSPYADTTTHQLLLEGRIKTNNSLIETSVNGNNFDGDWEIVDIDNWLEGNEFWVDDKEEVR